MSNDPPESKPDALPEPQEGALSRRQFLDVLSKSVVATAAFSLITMSDRAANAAGPHGHHHPGGPPPYHPYAPYHPYCASPYHPYAPYHPYGPPSGHHPYGPPPQRDPY